MFVKINGKDEEIKGAVSILDLLKEKRFNQKAIAIEHNLEIIPKERWPQVVLKQGDNIEIVRFMGGGSAVKDVLEIGGRCIKNRFFIGTGKFSSNTMIRDVLEASGAEVVTVALRRIDAESKDENMLDYIPKRCTVMINTSGARNAEEAVRIARLTRAFGRDNWIKIEVISDNKYLLPDNSETLKATEVLVKEGFVVLPYMSPDLIFARRLIEAGAKGVMPLGSPIGSNRGLKTEEIVKIMVNEIKAPVIVDAGLGSPSQAARCMEIGCSAVLVNTAVAMSDDPINMAKAFSLAVASGRLAYLAGYAQASGPYASSSSPLTGFLR